MSTNLLSPAQQTDLDDQMWKFAMAALAQIVQQDIGTAVLTNSAYRATCAGQWARRAAHKAFVRYPGLRGES